MDGSTSSRRPRISARDLLAGGTGPKKTARDVATTFVAGAFVATVARRALKSAKMDQVVDRLDGAAELARDPGRPLRTAGRIARNTPQRMTRRATKGATVATLVLSALMAIQSRRRSGPG